MQPSEGLCIVFFRCVTSWSIIHYRCSVLVSDLHVSTSVGLLSDFKDYGLNSHKTEVRSLIHEEQDVECLSICLHSYPDKRKQILAQIWNPQQTQKLTGWLFSCLDFNKGKQLIASILAQVGWVGGYFRVPNKQDTSSMNTFKNNEQLGNSTSHIKFSKHK